VLASRFDPDRELERFELRRAAREATLARLGRVVDARERLLARERELAVAAREAGASWGEIGAALRISRSQAHRRHAAADPRRALRRTDPWPPPVPPEIADEIAKLRAAEQRRRRRVRHRKRR
jgi:hypothetical protein